MRVKSVKEKSREIVALGIINCPLIIPYRLTKTCSDLTKQPLRVQYQISAQVYFADSNLEFINRICYARTDIKMLFKGRPLGHTLLNV